MNCERCHSLVDDYVDGTLAADERAAVETHLAGCADCRALANDLRAIRSTAGSLERHVPSAQAWTKIAAAVEHERARSLRGWFAWNAPGFRSGFAIAVTLLLVVGGTSWLVWNRMSPAEQAPRGAT